MINAGQLETFKSKYCRKPEVSTSSYGRNDTGTRIFVRSAGKISMIRDVINATDERIIFYFIGRTKIKYGIRRNVSGDRVGTGVGVGGIPKSISGVVVLEGG